MPLKRKTQVAVVVEDYPGAAVTFAGSDVIDTIEAAEFSGDPELISRDPSGGSLSRQAEAVGSFSAEVSLAVDAKGSGVATTVPRWGRLMLATFAEQIAVDQLNFATLSAQLEPGDVLTNASGLAKAVVMARQATGTTVGVRVVVTLGTFLVSEVITSAQKGASIGTLAGSAVLTTNVGLAYRPSSDTSTEATTTGSWTGGTPAAGEGLAIKVAGSVVGEGHFVSWATNILTMDLAYGSVPNSATVESTSGKTITLSASANVNTTKGATLALRHNLDKLVQDLTSSRATWTMSADAGNTSRLEFTVSGQPSAATEGSRLTASGLDGTTPPRFAGGVLSLNGILLPVKDFSFDAGNEVVQVADGNSPNGIKGGAITGRDPSLTVTVEQASLAGIDLFEHRAAGTTFGFGIQLGTTPGNTVTLCGPAAQVATIGFADDSGISTLNVQLMCRAGSASGDDEWYLAHV
jgi:hypothetical protein